MTSSALWALRRCRRAPGKGRFKCVQGSLEQDPHLSASSHPPGREDTRCRTQAGVPTLSIKFPDILKVVHIRLYIELFTKLAFIPEISQYKNMQILFIENRENPVTCR